MSGFLSDISHSLKEVSAGFVTAVEAPINMLAEDAQRLTFSKDVHPIIHTPKTDGSIAADIGKGFGILTDASIAAGALAPLAVSLLPSSVLPEMELVEGDSSGALLGTGIFSKIFRR